MGTVELSQELMLTAGAVMQFGALLSVHNRVYSIMTHYFTHLQFLLTRGRYIIEYAWGRNGGVYPKLITYFILMTNILNAI